MTEPPVAPRGEPGGAEPPLPAEHHLLVQAPVPAVDTDGLNVVSVGTLAFAVAAVFLALDYPQLRAEGRGWWLGVAVSGLLLGLLGLLYCWNRRRRRRAGHWNHN